MRLLLSLLFLALLATPAVAQTPACELCPTVATVPAAADAPAFEIAQTPVTLGEYARFVRETGHASIGHCFSPYRDENRTDKYVDRRWWAGPGFAQTLDHPVVCVTTDDARAYAAWLSGKTGLTWRLPTEAEYARAITAGAQPPPRRPPSKCTANLLDKTASRDRARDRGLTYERCDDGFQRTSPVTAFAADGLGLRDIAGNVHALVECAERCLAMGRGWAAGPDDAATLTLPAGGVRTTYIGFRLARSP